MESMCLLPNQLNKEVLGEISEPEMFNAFAFTFKLLVNVRSKQLLLTIKTTKIRLRNK